MKLEFRGLFRKTLANRIELLSRSNSYLTGSFIRTNTNKNKMLEGNNAKWCSCKKHI